MQSEPQLWPVVGGDCIEVASGNDGRIGSVEGLKYRPLERCQVSEHGIVSALAQPHWQTLPEPSQRGMGRWVVSQVFGCKAAELRVSRDCEHDREVMGQRFLQACVVGVAVNV